jgi:hypothetical protein
LTTFHAEFHHETLRQALSAICQKLGLQYELQDQAVQLHLLPPLQRLGRRCTVDELQSLDFLASTPLQARQTNFTADQLLATVDSKLEKSAYAIENRAFDPQDKTPVNVSRHATLLDALEEISLQTNSTWYPWGDSLVVLKKADQIRLQLSKRITLRFDGQDIGFRALRSIQPQRRRLPNPTRLPPKNPPAFRTVRLVLENATIEQALESIAGFTGLGYSITDQGVSLFTATPATASTQNN